MPPPEPNPKETRDVSALRIDRSKRRSRSLTWIGRVVGTIGLLCVFQFAVRPFASRALDLARPKVEVAIVARRNPSERASLTGVASNGYIVARVRASLSADAPGRVVEMNVVEGSVVTKGTAVARLYYDEYEALLARAVADLEVSAAGLARSEADIAAGKAAVERADSNLRAAQAGREAARAGEALAATDLERAQKLVSQGVEVVQFLDRAVLEASTAAAELDRAEARVSSEMAAVAETRSRLTAAEAGMMEAVARQKVAAAEVDVAAATLEKTFIRAPFDGIVVHKEAEVGEVVSPNSLGGRSRGSVVTMVDLSTLEVQAEVPETSLAAVREGGRAQVFIDAWPRETYEVVVDRIWPIADRQKATVEVRAVFLKPDARLRPEMGLRIVFQGGRDGEFTEVDNELLVTVPESAVVERDGVEGVFLIKEDRVTFREVRCGDGPPGARAVEAGLVGGERIVLRPSDELSDGDSVRTS